VAPDFAGAIDQAGVDPTLEGRALQDALRRAIATRRGSCSWTVDHAGWVVAPHSLEEQTFSGKTFEEALTWCLVWLMAPELWSGRFRSEWRCPGDNRDCLPGVYMSGRGSLDVHRRTALR
jgi:hypothetical protein